MGHVIIRRENGHRREVGFVAAKITTSLRVSTGAAKITIKVRDPSLPSHRRFFGFASLPRYFFSQAIAAWRGTIR